MERLTKMRPWYVNDMTEPDNTVGGPPTAHFPCPGWSQACVLHHRGHGAEHQDLIIAGGSRCETLRFERAYWRWQHPHRRHYLTFSGPVRLDRGTVRQMWQGFARLMRHPLGWTVQLTSQVHRQNSNHLLYQTFIGSILMDGNAILLLRRDGVVIPRYGPHSRPWALRTPT